jgi:hypothetical protein
MGVCIMHIERREALMNLRVEPQISNTQLFRFSIFLGGGSFSATCLNHKSRVHIFFQPLHSERIRRLRLESPSTYQ